MNDNALYRDYFNSDITLVEEFNRELIRLVNIIWNQVNMEVVLKESRTFTDGDPQTIAEARDLGDLLGKFNAWSDLNLWQRGAGYNSAHIISGKRSLGGLGVAFFATMCGQYATAAHQFSRQPWEPRHSTMYFAQVISHEMGHHLYLPHDDDEGLNCHCNTPSKRCVMWGASYIEKDMFSDCSRRILEEQSRKGTFRCLQK